MSLSQERIRQIEAKAQKKVKAVFSNETKLNRELTKVRKENLIDKEDFFPIKPGSLAFFYFIKNNLSLKERKLYELLVFSCETKDEKLAQIMEVSNQEYKTIFSGLN